MSVQIICADARHMPLADESVQCIVTSPPYWGLRKYAGEQELVWGDWRGAYGLEPTIEMYVAHTVEILRECRRVLRKDGVLFWNLGDSYNAYNGGAGPSNKLSRGAQTTERPNLPSGYGLKSKALKPKDLCLIPSRIALAAQSDGWWVRSMIVWAKPNPMPESVTDRPTDAYEHIIMLTKAERYFWDAEAVREGVTGGTHSRGYGDGGPKAHTRGSYEGWTDGTREVLTSRNLRNVWTFATQPYAEAHFATFPEELPRRCIKAATSSKGACLQCGAPWERVTRKTVTFDSGSGKSGNTPDGKYGADWDQAQNGTYDIRMGPIVNSQTIGWTPTCLCRNQRGKTTPCVVLDPFGGSGTTGRVAIELQRKAILLDLAYSHDYRPLAERRTRNVQLEAFV